MQVTTTDIAGLLLIEPKLFRDERGQFLETYRQERYEAAGIAARFVQDNQSVSRLNVLRGLHYQVERPQGKLVSVLHGEIYDVAVDLRQSSATVGRWYGVLLNSENHRQLYIPPGFAHGFCALQEGTVVVYKCTEYYAPQHERTIRWNDPQLAIRWPVATPLLSPKDLAGLSFREAPKFES